jgi:hypothetical protein
VADAAAAARKLAEGMTEGVWVNEEALGASVWVKEGEAD